jgi:transcriptional regulator with XRE-family HTH domain
MSARPTPNVQRRELARLLRELRHQRGYSLERVHRETGLDPGFLSRVERGERGLGDDNARHLAGLYGASPEVASRLGQLAAGGRQKTWWEQTDLPKQIKDYIGFEQAATVISIYGSIVPGLLQTRSYAEAAVRATDVNRTPESQATVVEQRLRRQGVLEGTDAPWVNVILDESAVRRQVGGVDVLRKQLRALLVAAERPRTTIRLIDFSVGAHPGMDSRFVMISTSETFAIDFVHVEGLSGFRNYQRPAEVERFTQAWEALTSVARSPADSMITLATVAAS